MFVMWQANMHGAAEGQAEGLGTGCSNVVGPGVAVLHLVYGGRHSWVASRALLHSIAQLDPPHAASHSPTSLLPEDPKHAAQPPPPHCCFGCNGVGERDALGWCTTPALIPRIRQRL